MLYYTDHLPVSCILYMLTVYVKVLGQDSVKLLLRELKVRQTKLTNGATVGGIFVDEFLDYDNSLKDLVESIDGIVSGPADDESKYGGLFWVAIRYYVSENCIKSCSKAHVAVTCLYL